jgi:2-polyprenyl-3-methyl-5-hydroxy-6-metoxy-1,4-benzoquinol methylase
MTHKRIVWNDEKVKLFWDYYSKFKNDYFTYQVGAKIVDCFADYLNPGSEILDYGSGPGYFISYLLKKDLKVTAMDFSKSSLDMLNGMFKDKEGFRGAYEVNQLEQKQLTFDVVFILEVVEHLDDYYLSLLFNNLNKLLKKDGIAIITTPNNENLEENLILCPECNTLFHRWQHLRSWNIDTLRNTLIKENFKILEIYTTNFNKIKPKIYQIIKESIKGLFKDGNYITEKSSNPNLVAIISKAGNNG